MISSIMGSQSTSSTSDSIYGGRLGINLPNPQSIPLVLSFKGAPGGYGSVQGCRRKVVEGVNRSHRAGLKVPFLDLKQESGHAPTYAMCCTLYTKSYVMRPLNPQSNAFSAIV